MVIAPKGSLAALSCQSPTPCGFNYGWFNRTANPEENRMKQLVKKFMNEESGQDLIEYALIAALIALAAVTAMKTLANNIGSEFNTVGSSV